MRNWSMVRRGSTSSQKPLLFNLRRVQARLKREASQRGESLDQHQLRQMAAAKVGVPIHDVEMMEGRLSGSDHAPNATRETDEGRREWIDAPEDHGVQAAEAAKGAHDGARLRGWLVTAMQQLNARERYLVVGRKLKDEWRTLESLGKGLGLSKERVLQRGAAAFAKMRKSLEGQSREVRNFLARAVRA